MNKDIEVTTSQKDDIAIINIKGDVTADTGGAIEDAKKMPLFQNQRRFCSISTRTATLTAAASPS